jgi:hypothetical protein
MRLLGLEVSMNVQLEMTVGGSRSRLAAIVVAVAVAVALSGIAACGSTAHVTKSGSSQSRGQSSDTSASPTAGSSKPPPSSGTKAPLPGKFGIDDTYYPVALGNTWVYRVDYGAALGLGVVTDTEEMTKVHHVAVGTRVTIARTFHYQNGRYPDFTSTVDYVFHKNGSLTVPFQNGIQTRGTTITVKSGSIVWPTPQTLESGHKSTGHIRASIKSAGQTINADVLVLVRGVGTASVRVPAGLFPRARVLHQDLVETISRISTRITIKTTTYLVEGVGMVKNTVDSGLPGSGGSVTTRLISFKRG